MTGEPVIVWDRVPLRNICEQVNYGYTASAKREAIGPKFVRITDIVDELIDWQSVPYCKISDREFAKYELQQGDIVIARTGATSGYAKTIKKHPKAVFASYLVRLRIKEDHDWHYVGLVIESDDYKRYIKSVISGAAQPQANAQVLTSFPIPLPPLPIQRKIAAILSAYDDLIENNTRRIKILEEMAQTIYREWFVNFRFPGHEKVKMVESELGMIPEGWEVMPLGDVVDTVGGGTPSTKNPEYWEDGTVTWFIPSDLTKSGSMFIFDSEKKITEKGLEKSSAKLFPAYSVMMTSRATIGVTAINTKQACTNQGFVTCIPNERVSAFHIYLWIQENLEQITSIASGATYKEINRTEFRSLPIIVPDLRTEKRYVDLISPIVGKIENLLAKNANLRRTRDLLLPRLISGEIDVEDLDIDTEGLGNG